MATKTSFYWNLLVGLCLCLGMAGGLAAQPALTVTISGTLGPYISGSGEITSAKYVSGITAIGAKGTTCLISINGGTTPATAKVLLGAANTIAPGTIPTSNFSSFGAGYIYTTPPTPATAAVSNGTATCTGTAALTVTVDDTLGLIGGSFTGVNTIDPVGVPYGGATTVYSNLPITFSAGGIQLTCNATVTVGAPGSGNDTVSVSNCTFKAGNTAFASTVAFNGGTIPAAVPMAFPSVPLISSASSGTYIPGTGSTFNGDSTTVGISGTILAVCSGCPTENLSTTSLSFAAVVGGSAPPTQPVTVSNSPAENEPFAVSTSASWLTATPAGGTTGSAGAPFSVGVNPAGLAVGSYTGTVCVYSAASNSSSTSVCNNSSNATPTVTVSLTVAPPSFTLQASSLSAFNSVNSATVLAQNLAVTTSTGAQVAFTAAASSTPSWLSVSPTTGTTGVTTITVSADPTKVPGPGTYIGSITLTAAGATNSPLVINNITLNVTTVPTPAALTFNGNVGGPNPPQQPLSVTATGPNVTYTASASSSGWLAVTPASGTTNGSSLTVSVNTTGLGANTYDGSIIITPNGGKAISVPVTLTLSSLPSMGVPPGTAPSFAYTPGSTPPGQALVVSSSSSTAINYNVTTTSSGGQWLQVLPASGATGSTETVSIVTSVASTLANGSYSGTVVFTCTPVSSCGNANGQLSVPVTLTVTATLTPSPASVTFNYTIGASTTLPPIPIGASSNGQPITYTASAASTSTNGAWLVVSPTGSVTTPNGVTASVNASALTGLGAGTYNGSITLTSTGATNSPVTIPATLVVSAALQTSSGSLTFAYQTSGSTPPSQPLSITSNGAPGTQLVFTATATGTSNSITWLSVSPSSGTTPQSLTVSVAPAGLPANTYNGFITVTSAQAANSPLVIPVTLTVSTLPSLTANPSSLSTSYTVGGSVPVLPTVAIGTTGSSPLNGLSASPTVPWLSASLNAASTPATLTISLVQASIPTTPASYQGFVTINATGAAAPLNYQVTLTVSAQPALAASPLSLAFTGQLNGANPAAQPLSVTSTGGSVTFAAVAATNSGGSWLSVNPLGGSTNAVLQVSVNTSGLAAANYSGSITITAAGATGSPVVVPVSLSVTSVPNLIAAPTTLLFNYVSGAAAPTGQSVAVSTSNNASAAFSVSASTTGGGGWLQASPASGASPSSFLANIVANNLAAGTYNGTLTISATGFNPAKVAVTLVVTQAKAVIQITGSTLFVLANTAAPATSTLAVSASDGSAQAFTIAAGPSPNNWLSLSPTSGTTPANVVLTVNPAGLIPGIYVIPITVTMPGLPVPTKTISVQLTITGSNLLATPNMLTFVYQPGLPLPAAQPVALTTITGGSVALTSVTTNVSWLIVSPASSAPATLQVSINPGLLQAGTFIGDVLVKGVGSPDASLEIPVTLTVNPAPVLTAAPASLAFNYQIGGPVPASLSFVVSSGNVIVNFTATSPGNWLQLTGQNGSTPGSVLVTANPAGLAAGTYGGAINVTSLGAPTSVAVAVTLTVTGQPQLAFAPSQLFFAFPMGGSTPAPQTLTVTSVGGPIAFTAAGGSSWLGVTPASGTTPAALAVSINPVGLAVGTYNGTVNITPAGSAVPTMVLVTLQVGSGGPTPTIAGLINAASGAIGMVAPGMAVSIFGTTLGPQTGVAWTVPPAGGTVATTLAATEVLFDGTPVPLLFTSTGQVNALAPFELAGKPNTVLQVVYNGVTSAGLTLPVLPAEPGSFTANDSGSGQGAILNQDGSVNSASLPAAAGSVIQLFGTGGGLTDPPSTDGTLNPISSTGALTLKTTATVGGQPATVTYAGPAPGLVSGIFQINLTLPAGTPSGNVPVIVQVGTASSQSVTVAVQ